MTDNTLFEALFANCQKDKPFAFLPDGLEVSYGEMLDASAQFANALVAVGVQPGDRVAVQVEKSIEAIQLYIGTVRAGAIFLPLNTAYTPGEIEYFIQNATPRLFVCDPKSSASYEKIATDLGLVIETLDVGGNGSLKEKVKTASTEFSNVARGPDDLAAILYTSGTTGRSKGAMLSHNNLLSNAQTLKEIWQFTESDVLLHALPIFHTHGLFVATNVSLLAGASVIFQSRFDVDAIIDALPQATSIMGVPTFYTRLLDDKRFSRDLVGHMRLFISGSAPLLAETHVQFENRTGHRILERYGMTETNMNTSNPYEGERRAGTVGFPLPDVELRIVDEATGETVTDGEIGILEVKGPNVFHGYWQMPEKTAEEFRDDGFFITGDLGTRDEDGYVKIVGRSKDLIISGGYNIYPKEVELLLDDEAGVLESAVIGLPDSDFGEAVVGVVVADGTVELDEAALMQSIRSKIARFKQPKRIVIVDELPRNTMGKVQKNVLREQHKNLL